MLGNPFVSVVVPVYKSEKCLGRCVESVLGQTFGNFELILVDDGSPDGSGKICMEYAARDSRVRVLRRENGGVSRARNAGLDAARGAWISFLDSDDWIDAGMLEKMCGAIAGPGGMIVSDCLIREWPDGVSVAKRIGYSRRFYSRDSIAEFMEENAKPGYNGGSSCSKMYDVSLLRHAGLRFLEGISAYEDTLFTFLYSMECSYAAIVEGAPYHYMQTYASSLSRKRHAYSQYLRSSSEALSRWDAWVAENGGVSVAIQRSVLSRWMSIMLYSLFAMYNSAPLPEAGERMALISRIASELRRRGGRSGFSAGLRTGVVAALAGSLPPRAADFALRAAFGLRGLFRRGRAAGSAG